MFAESTATRSADRDPRHFDAPGRCARGGLPRRWRQAAPDISGGRHSAHTGIQSCSNGQPCMIQLPSMSRVPMKNLELAAPYSFALMTTTRNVVRCSSRALSPMMNSLESGRSSPGIARSFSIEPELTKRLRPGGPSNFQVNFLIRVHCRAVSTLGAKQAIPWRREPRRQPQCDDRPG